MALDPPQAGQPPALGPGPAVQAAQPVQQEPEPILTAAAEGDLRRVLECLIVNRASMNARHPTIGWTPVMFALTARHLEIVDVLLQIGAGVNYTDDNDESALSLTVRLPFLEGLRVLLNHGSDVNWESPADGRTLLAEAAHLGYLDVLQELIAHRAELIVRDMDGNTPLHLAVLRGHVHVLQSLVREMNKPMARINRLNRFLTAQAALNIRNKTGASPLWLAAAKGKLQFVQLLVEAGADINAPDQDGRTPLKVARDNGFVNVAAFLVGRGATEQAPDPPLAPPTAEYGINNVMALMFNEPVPARLGHPRFVQGSRVELIEEYDMEGDSPAGVTFDSASGEFGGASAVVPFDDFVNMYTTNEWSRSVPFRLRISVSTDLGDLLQADFTPHLHDILLVFPKIRDLSERMDRIPEELREAELNDIIETEMRITSPQVRDRLRERLLQILSGEGVARVASTEPRRHRPPSPPSPCDPSTGAAETKQSEPGGADEEGRDSESSTLSDEILPVRALTEEDIAVLSGEKPDTSLNLLFRNLTAADARIIAEHLTSNTTLTELSLGANKLGDEGVGYIAEALRQNSTLQTLDLAGNKLGPESARYLAEALQKNTALRTLILGGNDLGAEGAQYLAEALRTNSTLQHLIMHKNNVGPEGAKHIADALRENSSLETLILEDSSIGAEGTRYLADVLMENRTVQKLSVGGNDLGAEGAGYVAEMLCVNKTLQWLDVWNNNLGVEGARQLAKALHENVTLKELSVDYNNIGAEGALLLMGALRVNSGLQKLSLLHNKLREEGARATVEALAEIPHLSLTSFAGVELKKHLDILHLPSDFAEKSNEDILNHLRQAREQQETKEDDHQSTDAAADLPDWLRPLAALVGVRDIDDKAVDKQLRHCVLDIVAACGLPTHGRGVRCLWLVDKAATLMRAVAVSPSAPNTRDCWQVVEECSVELDKSGEAAPALPSAAEAVVLRALDVLGVVGAPARFTLLQLNAECDAIRAAQQKHFETLIGVVDELVYSKAVVSRMQPLPTPPPPQDTPKLLSQASMESDFIAQPASTPSGVAIKSTLGEKFLRFYGADHPSEVTQDQVPVLFLKLKINSLTEVDIASSAFKADFTLMVDWYDPSVAKLTADEQRAFHPKDHFYPVVLIDNLADELEGDYNVQIRLDKKAGIPGYVKFTKRFVTKLTTPISCHEFPFDKQALQFEFRAQGIDGNPALKVRFGDTLLNSTSADQETKTEDFVELYKRTSPRPDFFHSTARGADRLAEWQFHSLVGFPDFVVHDNNADGKDGQKEEREEKEASTADDVEITEKYIVQLWVARNPRAGFLNILLPIALIGGLSLATYSIPIADFGARSAAILTLLLTLVAFKFSLDKKLPQVPYLTTLDIHLLATMMMLAVQLSFQSIAGSSMGSAVAPLLDGLVFFITGLFWLGLQVYIVDRMMNAEISLPTGKGFFITPPPPPPPQDQSAAEADQDADSKLRIYSAVTPAGRSLIEKNEKTAQDVRVRRRTNLQAAASRQETIVHRVAKQITHFTRRGSRVEAGMSAPTQASEVK